MANSDPFLFNRSPCGGSGEEEDTPVAAIIAAGRMTPPHPLYATLLGFPLSLFLGALLGDFAYRSTFHIQWANFSAWLIAGGLVFGGLAMLWALVNVFRHGPAGRAKRVLHFAVLLAMCIVGFVNALVHAKDAWATMPEGLYLSTVTLVLAALAAWTGYARFQNRDVT